MRRESVGAKRVRETLQSGFAKSATFLASKTSSCRAQRRGGGEERWKENIDGSSREKKRRSYSGLQIITFAVSCFPFFETRKYVADTSISRCEVALHASRTERMIRSNYCTFMLLEEKLMEGFAGQLGRQQCTCVSDATGPRDSVRE